MFETNDNDRIDDWLKSRGAGRHRWIFELERFRPRLLGFGLAAVLLISGIYRYGLPVLVDVAVALTPSGIPEVMSRSTLKSLEGTLLHESKLAVAKRDRIRAEFRSVAQYASGGLSRYDLLFRDAWGIGPNAFALPDGTIVLTDQLVELAGTDDEMILGVLAHEIGHVEKQHSLRQMYRALGMIGLVSLIAGDVGDSGEELLNSGMGLMSLSFSRQSEAEADRVSVDLMLKAHHDPVAIARFFQLLQKKYPDHSYMTMLSTHPATPEREKDVETYAKRMLAAPSS